jgi:hypothetical protein
MDNDKIVYYTPHLLTPLDGFIQTTVPERFRERILSELNNSNVSVGNNLIGHIKNQTALNGLLNDSEWLAYLKQVCEGFASEFEPNTKINTNFLEDIHYIDSLVLDQPWVNKMKKTEFNPCHNHRGIYSYVLWVKIPYDIEEEKKYFPDPNVVLTSAFSFLVACDKGLIQHPIYVDKTYEWEMILFSSSLWHCVYPFYTSDEERISVAGNLLYRPTNVVPISNVK